jgi:ABC-type phosphate transport system substrate-binding protein
MSRFRRRKSAKRGFRAALLAGATVAALAVAGVGAGSASAAVSCNGGNIIGEGSSLQKIAQQNVWIPAFTSEICNFGTEPKIEYKPEGSGAGLKSWGAGGGAIDRTRAFIGSDDAPTEAQIANIKAAAGGGNLLVIPVAQTAIAVPVNPPEGCTVTQIANAELERIFRGVEKTWSELETATGTCNSPITRVVRKDGSGTSYQFKNYLSSFNSAALPCIGKTWKELEPIENAETSAPNTSWPESCTGKTLTTVVRSEKTGGGELVVKVQSTPGSIGYAALPDVQSKGASFVELQNNGRVAAEEATFASPVIAGASKGKGVANCAETKYSVPKEARNTGTGLDVDWSQVFGAQPSIGGSAYPLCTLTYILAFDGYKSAGFKFAPYQTVRDYVNGYIAFGGQAALINTETNYAPVPEVKGNATFNVFAAMRKAAALISQ